VSPRARAGRSPVFARATARPRPTALACLFAILACGVPGCVLPPPCPEKLVPLSELVRQYNMNADAVPRLWARADMSVTLAGAATGVGDFTWRSGSPTCLLLLAKGTDRLGPQDFVLVGRETAAMELFRLGVSTEQGEYYFWYRFGDRKGAWCGRTATAAAPGMAGVPLDPMQLLSVLAVCPLPADQTSIPAVVVGMRNTPGDCAYVVTCLDRQPVSGRILLRREMFFRWGDQPPRRPYRVDLFDPAGRRVMTAELKDYRPIDVSKLDDRPPVQPDMPTDIDVAWNDQPGLRPLVRRIHMVLSEMTAEDKWDRSACKFVPPAGVVPVRVDRDVLGPATRPAASHPAAGTPPAAAKPPATTPAATAPTTSAAQSRPTGGASK
jgi:hypothetical protein